MPPAARPRPSADLKLRQELARAARTIRLADVTSGILALLALALGYTALVVLLDRFVELPPVARGLALAAAAVVAVAIVVTRVARPLVTAINPRFAARRVEAATPGAKNAVINWVDLEREDLGETIRNSLANRAASQVAAADPQKLAESRGLTPLLVACGILVALLAGLFLWLKPAPFLSLVTRAYNPFTVATIATRSEIVLEAPEGGNVSVLAGDVLPVRVTVMGRVPEAGDPDRVRLLIRYSPDAVPEEFPLAPGAGPREFAADLASSVVQNGFTYRVAAGDAETPEYQVSVRPRPVITKYGVLTTFPAYTRLKPEETADPKIEAIKGSEVALTVTGNRPLAAGQLRLTSQAQPVEGEPVAGAPDQLRFRFTVRESGEYRVNFTTRDGDVGDPTASHKVLAVQDARPTVTIDRPEPDLVTLPLSGQLAVDGVAADDFGVSKVALKLQLVGGRNLLLEPIPYRPGESLEREPDKSFPTRVEVKLSAGLSKLKLQSGEPANLAVGTQLDYWLEATDNCTVPQSNVGRSKPKRLVIGAEPPPQAQAENQKRQAERKAEEEAHKDRQNQQFNQENREQEQPNAQKPPADGEPQQGGEPQPGQPSDAGGEPQQGNAGSESQPQPGQTPPPGQEGSAPQPQPKSDDPAPKPNPDNQSPEPGQPGQPQSQPPGQPKDQKSGQPGQPQNQPKGSNADPNAKPPQEGQPSTEQQPGGEPGANAPKQPGQPDPKVQQEANRVQEAARRAEAEQKQRQELEQAARDLASGDPQKQQGARDKLDSMIGQDNRERAEREAKQLADDLRSGEPKREQAARDKIKEAAERMQQSTPENQARDAANNLDSPSDSERTQAEQKLDETVGVKNRRELQEEAGQMSPPSEADKQARADRAAEMAKERKEIEQAARDLASGDPDKKRVAEEKLDSMVGRENRKAAQQKAEQLKNDLASNDPARRERAKQELNDLKDKLDEAQKNEAGKESPQPKNGGDDVQPSSKPKPKDGPGAAQRPTDEQVREASKNLASDDPKAKADAEKTLDNAVGEENRKELQKQAEDLKADQSKGTPGQQPANEEKQKELQDQAVKQANQKGATKPGREESAPKAGESNAAPRPDDQGGGKPSAQGDPTQKPKLTDKPGQGQKPADPKAIQEALKDLQSGDQTKQDAARKTLDDQIGQENRERAEAEGKQLADDLKSNDPATRQAAEEKVNDLARKANKATDQAQKQPGDNGQPAQKSNDQARAGGDSGQKSASEQAPAPKPSKAEQEKVAQAANDLANGTPEQKEAARQALDKEIGKENREIAEQEAKQLAEDLKSGDPKRQEAARQRLKDLQEQVNDQQQQQSQDAAGEPSPETKQAWRDKAKDLNSTDPKARQDAEKAFDDAIGQDERKRLQDAQKEADAGTPEQKTQAEQQANAKADQAAHQEAKERGPGSAGREREGDRLLENAKNRLKTAELQLADLEKIKSDPELQRRVGYTPEQYEAFLKSVRESVARQREEVARVAEEVAKPGGPAAVKTGGTRSVTARPGEGAGTGSGVGVPPPGFADALKKFGQEASKTQPPSPR